MYVCLCSGGGVGPLGPLPSCTGGGVGLFQRGSQAWPGLQEFTSPPPLTSPGNCQSQTQLRTGLCVLGRPAERDSKIQSRGSREKQRLSRGSGEGSQQQRGTDGDHHPHVSSSTTRNRGRPEPKVWVDRWLFSEPLHPHQGGAAISNPFST